MIKNSSLKFNSFQQNLPPNPIDLKYDELSSDIRLIDSSHCYYDVLFNYLQQGEDLEIENIWEIRRDSEDASFSSYSAMDNHRLLMHVTSVSSVIANIKNGLRMEPSRYSQRNGRGVYFQNTIDGIFEDLGSEYRNDGKLTSIIFLAEVALGNMKVTYG